MKDFFEDLGKRLEETAETMTNKAGEAIEIQRLKGKVRALARENAVDLMEMGRMVYESYKKGESVDEKSKTLCDAVIGREENMKEYNKKIAHLKGGYECASCGKMVGKDMIYCPYCGAKAEPEDIYEDENVQKSSSEATDPEINEDE